MRFPILARIAPSAAARGAFMLALLLFGLDGPARGQVPKTSGAGASLRSVPEALNFANGLYRDRRYDLAAQEYRDFLKTAPPGPDADDARYGLANSELFLNHYKEARRAFEAFLKDAPANNPNFGTATFRVGETAYLLGDLAAARAALEKFVADNPGHRHEETAWSHLADVCLRLDDLKRAREAYEKVLSMPDGRLANRARLLLGRTLASQGSPAEAVKVLGQLAETGGAEWSDKARFEIGKVELGAGRLEQAAAAFESVETGTPKSQLVPEARLRRAEALGRLGRHDQAEALLRPLVEAPTPAIAAQAADALGASLLARGKPADAFAALDESATRFAATTVGPLLRFHSAEAAQALGKLDEARDRFLKVAEVGPDHPLADDALVRAAGIGLEANDLRAAKTLAQSLPRKFPRSDRKADARLIEARVALLEKDPKAAIALLETPDGDEKPAVATVQATRYYLALAYRADGQTARANEILDTLTKNPTALTASGAQFMLGQGLVDAGKFAEALPPLEQYLAGKPNGEYADYALAYVAQAQVGLGKADDARATLETLATRFPQSKALPATRLRLAEAAVEAMAYDRAVELFRQAAEGSDNSLKARARSGLGWALIKLKKPVEAASAYESLLKETPDDPLAPDAALARAQALEAARQVEPALTAYETVLTRYAKSDAAGPAALGRARLLVEAKRPAEAIEAFAKVEAEYPKAASPDVLLAERGWALVDLGKTAEADAMFERLLKDFSESPRAGDARFNLAESAFGAGHYDKVAPLLAPVVAEGSKARPGLVASSLYRLGRTQAELKDWKAASETFARLAKEFPDGGYRREASFWKAEVAFQAGDAKAAEVGLAALIAEAAGPDEPASLVRTAKRRRAQALVQLESWKEALAVAESYGADPSPGQADPHRADVDYARGRALQGLARFEDARAAYARVIEARKGSELAAKAQFMRGETWFHQKDYREALREFLKVDYLYDAPTWQANALLEAGKVHEQLGQWTEAAETYERLRSRFPNDPNAAQAQARLEVARKRAEGTTQAGGTTGTEVR